KAINEISLQIDESYLQISGTGLQLNLHETGGLANIQGAGTRVKLDPLGCLFTDLAGLDVKVGVNSGLSKVGGALQVDVDESGAIFKDTLGLDARVDEVTIGKELGRLVCRLKGDVDGDITVTPGGLISSNLSAGNGLQKIGTMISLLPEVEDALDSVDDLKDTLDNTVDKLDNALGDITDLTSNVENLANNLASVAEHVMSTAAQIGTAAAAGAVGGGVSSGLALTAAGKLAKDGVQSLISANAAKVIGGGLAAASLAGILGGLLGSLGGKKTYNTNISGDQGVSDSGVVEGTSDLAWGYSISQGYNFNLTLFPNKQTSMAVIGPMLGTNLGTTGSTSPFTGQWCVYGGMGVSERIYASGDIYMNTNQKVATEAFVS
ncbi:hypothetical protein HK097_004583, partial [Rhizophlyctis rosea]